MATDDFAMTREFVSLPTLLRCSTWQWAWFSLSLQRFVLRWPGRIAKATVENRLVFSPAQVIDQELGSLTREYQALERKPPFLLVLPVLQVSNPKDQAMLKAAGRNWRILPESSALISRRLAL
ncbi:MAG: hypothetical protein ACI835_002036 [Planctomycetota bacterium]